MSFWIVLILGVVSPIWGLTRDIDVLLQRRNLARVSFRECKINPSERGDCGYYGITEEGCYSRECCWNESDESGVPWCYHSIPTSNKRCVASEDDRESCGRKGIRKEQCLAQDCCWRPSNKRNVAPCITKKRLPVYSGECGYTAITPMTLSRIIGGDEAIPHSWPWIVSIQVDGRHSCGGSLINHEWVLSAGHCGHGTEGVSIVLGAHNVSTNDAEKTKIMMPVAKIFIHENYGNIPTPPGEDYGGVEYDYMLMKLEHPVEFNSVISPVCLAIDPPHAGKHCYSMGWGVSKINTETHETEVPDLLQQFMSPVVDHERCNSAEMYNARIADTSMCAGYDEGGRGNCFGDSGGPLVCKMNGRWEQVGIVSWGEPCAQAMYPTVYAEVTQMIQWMEDIVADN